MAAKCHTHSKGYGINETYIFLALNVEPEPEADDYRRNTKIVDIRSSVTWHCVTCTKALLLAVRVMITKSVLLPNISCHLASNRHTTSRTLFRKYRHYKHFASTAYVQTFKDIQNHHSACCFLYGCETWSLEGKMRVFENMVLRYLDIRRK